MTAKHDCRPADPNSNYQPGALALHGLLIAEHNALADQARATNPTWDDERLFQEARCERSHGSSSEREWILHKKYWEKLNSFAIQETCHRSGAVNHLAAVLTSRGHHSALTRTGL